MTDPQTIFLVISLGFAAMLYSSVGHGGASAYIAVLTLFGFAAAVIRPTALVFNVVVACIAMVQFARARHVPWHLFTPLALAAVPMAFVGGMLSLPTNVHRIMLGVVLLYAAAYLLWGSLSPRVDEVRRRLALPWLLAIGAAIGLLSGLTGVGGGIFLSPLLLALYAATTRDTSGTSAAFILVNSIAGLAGLYVRTGSLPNEIPTWMLAGVVAVAIGGAIGATWGAKHLATKTLRRILALVLAIAGLKMLGIG
jgi:uncharacterized membrane protein YfcA